MDDEIDGERRNLGACMLVDKTLDSIFRLDEPGLELFMRARRVRREAA